VHLVDVDEEDIRPLTHAMTHLSSMVRDSDFYNMILNTLAGDNPEDKFLIPEIGNVLYLADVHKRRKIGLP